MREPSLSHLQRSRIFLIIYAKSLPTRDIWRVISASCRACRTPTRPNSRIHKRGTKLGRTALVQSALIGARYSPYLKRFYEQVKARRGAGKAIIALARKFLGVINWTLKNGWVFEDFPNFVLAEAHSGTHHRESKTTQFLRLAKDANQIAVDKTS